MELIKISSHLILIVFLAISNFPFDCYGARIGRDDKDLVPAPLIVDEVSVPVDHVALAALEKENNLVPLVEALHEAMNPVGLLQINPQAEVDQTEDPKVLPVTVPVQIVEVIPELVHEAGSETLSEVNHEAVSESLSGVNHEAVSESLSGVNHEAMSETLPEANHEASSDVLVLTESPIVDAVISAPESVKKPTPVDLTSCQFESLETIQNNMVKMLGNPTDVVTGKDYACTIISILKHSQDNKASVTNLESKIESVKSNLESVYQDVSQHSHRFITVEKLFNDTSAEEFEEISVLRQKLYHFILRGSKEVQTALATLIEKNSQEIRDVKTSLNVTIEQVKIQATTFESALTQLKTKGQSWIEKTDILESTVREILTRGSALEIEIVSRITEIVHEMSEIGNKLKHAIDLEAARAVQEESDLKTKISEESQKLQASLENLESQFTSQKSVGHTDHTKIVQQLHENITKIHHGLNDQISEGFEVTKVNQLQLQKLIEAQTDRLDTVDFELTNKLQNEISRANTAEMKLTETLLHQTSLSRMTEGSLKTALESEISSRIEKENGMQKHFSDQNNKLKQMEKDCKIQTEIETLRAKGTEAQLSTIIMTEVERAKASEIDLANQLQGNVSRLISDLMSEYNRAKSSEDKLNKKINEEISRAISTESNLLANINDELKRASEKEHELHISLTNDGIWLRKLANDLESKIKNVDARTDSVEEEFSAKLKEQTKKVQQVKEHFVSVLKNEVNKSQSSNALLKESIEQVVNRTTQFESQVLSLIMAEVTRAKDSETNVRTNLTDEIHRAKQIELAMTEYLYKNFTQLMGKLGVIFDLVDLQTAAFEEMGSETGRNFSNQFQTLGREMNQKLEQSIQNVETRLTKMNEEIKKSVNYSWWRYPSSSTTAGSSGSGNGVFNKFLGLFGRNRTKSGKPISTASTSSTNSTSPKVSRLLDHELNMEDLDMSEELIQSLNLTSILLGDELDKRDLLASDGKDNEDALKDVSVKRNFAETVRAMPVFVRRSKSKVRNMYG